MNYQQSVSNRRSSMLKKNIIASLVAKGCSAVIVFLMVPITLNCLGEYTNGVWLTISSVMLWIDNLDIGLGNGLRNKLAVYLAHYEEERARILVSSAFAMLTIIIIPALLLLIAFFTVCDTYQLLNVDPAKVSGLDQILIITLIFVCTTFILKLIGNFYMGMQLPAVSNILIATGQTLALIGTFAIYKSGSHSLLHIALVNTAAPLLVYVTAYPYTFWYKYPHLRPSIRMVCLKEAKEVITMGVQFFVIQLSGVILFMTSNILISNLFTPSMVTPYLPILQHPTCNVYRYLYAFLECNDRCLRAWRHAVDPQCHPQAATHDNWHSPVFCRHDTSLGYCLFCLDRR